MEKNPDYRALFLSPMIPSFCLEKTESFFCDLLDFQKIMSEESYAVLSKNNLSLHLLPAGPDIGQMEFYLEVTDIEAVWQRLENRIAHLKHKAPFDRPYGMREIHIEVPETNCLLFIGQAIVRANG